jgi:acetylornithine deacetylase/succinyl-diaminopimelate desuccinylase-like protein
MISAQQLRAVLARIDADLEQSLARLFDFLRIPSISTDAAYKEHCVSAAKFVAADLAGIRMGEKSLWRAEPATTKVRS